MPALRQAHRIEKNVKYGTEKARKNFLKLLGDDPLGSQSIEDVKPSDAKAWAIRMSEKGYSYQTIKKPPALLAGGLLHGGGGQLHPKKSFPVCHEHGD